jgi:hypothetical protein
LKRIGAALAVAALVAAVALEATPASARDKPGPCDFHRRDGETVKHFAKRRIACAVRRFGPIPGGTTRAICIARRESGLDPSATSEPTGQYRGLYQHDRDYWSWRYDRYTKAGWKLSTRALNGRTNSIVAIRMVFDIGTWKKAGWPRKEC